LSILKAEQEGTKRETQGKAEGRIEREEEDICVYVCSSCPCCGGVEDSKAKEEKGPQNERGAERRERTRRETPSSRSRISELKRRPACKLGNSSCQSRDVIGGNGATTAGGGEGKLILGEMEKMVGVRHTFPLLLFPPFGLFVFMKEAFFVCLSPHLMGLFD
jgi:hypothetical protein